MTFSFKGKIPPTLHLTINHQLKKIGLNIKRKKTKYLYKSKYKNITGAVISPKNELLIANKHLKKINDLKENINSDEITDIKKLRSVTGIINYARQIKPNSHNQLYKKFRQKEKETREL